MVTMSQWGYQSESTVSDTRQLLCCFTYIKDLECNPIGTIQNKKGRQKPPSVSGGKEVCVASSGMVEEESKSGLLVREICTVRQNCEECPYDQS